MSIKKYNDLNILFLHIDNQTKFLKHKEKLKNVKGTITKSTDFKELDRARDVFKRSKELNTTFVQKNFYCKESQDNLKIRNKLVSILHRPNVSNNSVYYLLFTMLILAIYFLLFFYFNFLKQEKLENKENLLYAPILNRSKDAVNKYKSDRLFEENQLIKKRIKLHPSHDLADKYEENYKQHLYYKKFNKSFNLPEIRTQT